MNKCIAKFRKRRYDRLTARGIRADADWKESDHPRDENGQFASGGGGGNAPKQKNKGESISASTAAPEEKRTSFKETESKYRKMRNNLCDTLKDKPDGTYDPETGKPISFKDGYQVAFQTSVSEDLDDEGYVSDEDYDRIVEELCKRTGSPAYVGKFDVNEISFHCETMEEAMDIAKKYNQHSIMDWATFHKLSDNWTEENDLLMFPRNPFYNPELNHVKDN